MVVVVIDVFRVGQLTSAIAVEYWNGYLANYIEINETRRRLRLQGNVGLCKF